MSVFDVTAIATIAFLIGAGCGMCHTYNRIRAGKERAAGYSYSYLDSQAHRDRMARAIRSER